MKRVISLLLVCCFLALALVACGNNGGKPTETAKPTEAPKKTDIYGQDDLGSVTDWDSFDFEGEEINILVRNDDENMREWGKEDVGDDELDLAIYNRNEVVWDKLNITVNLISTNTSDYEVLKESVPQAIMNDIDNANHNIDIVAHFAYIAGFSGLRDYHANLMDTDTFPHFNFKLKCWNQAIVNNVAVNNKLYSIAGDLNISLFNKAIVMWHNKDLYERVKADKDPADIQDLAIAGNWTYSELYKWSSYHTEVNSEGDCGDIYGVYIHNTHPAPVPTDAVPYAWDLELVTTSADGSHTFNCVGNDKAEQAMVDWRALFNGEGNAANGTGCTCSFGLKSHFTDGDVLFMTDVLYASKDYNMAIREMDDKYSILPMPKYNEGQENYGSTAGDSYTLIAVLDHSHSTLPTKGEAVSAYLQYATEYSYTHVRGYYFKKIIEPKFFGTDDSDGHVTKSITIFYTIVNNLEFEFQTIYSASLNDVAWLFRDTTINGGTIDQVYSSGQKDYSDKLYALDSWLGLVN